MFWYNYVNSALLLVIWIIIFLNLGIYRQGREFWLTFFAIYSLTEFISFPMEIKGVNNLWLYNISKPLQFLFIIIYFTRLLNLQKTGRYALIGLSFLAYLPFLLFTRITDYNSLMDITFSCIILVCCAIYFYSIMKTDEYVFLPLSEFWFCTSLFVYFGTNLCINGALNFLLEEHFGIARKLFYVLVINSYVFYMLVIYALLSARSKYLKLKNGR